MKQGKIEIVAHKYRPGTLVGYWFNELFCRGHVASYYEPGKYYYITTSRLVIHAVPPDDIWLVNEKVLEVGDEKVL